MERTREKCITAKRERRRRVCKRYLYTHTHTHTYTHTYTHTHTFGKERLQEIPTHTHTHTHTHGRRRLCRKYPEATAMGIVNSRAYLLLFLTQILKNQCPTIFTI